MQGTTVRIGLCRGVGVGGRRHGSPMWAAAILSLSGLLLIQCGTAGGGGTPVESVTDVAIRDFTFVPKAVTIKQGESVRWTDREVVARHTVTSGNPDDTDAGVLWDSGLLGPGQSFVRQFDDVGTFVYFCEPHKNDPGMRDATVTVEAADVPLRGTQEKRRSGSEGDPDRRGVKTLGWSPRSP